MSEQKTDVHGIYKIKDGILINKDNEALEAYKKKKRQSLKLKQLEDDVNELKTGIEEIKDLIKGLLK